MASRLEVTARTATLDASGTARVYFQPPSNKVWDISTLVINVTKKSTSAEPRCYLYKNAEIPTNQYDATYQGSRNTSSKPIQLQPGDTLTVLWTLGTAGDVATATMTATETDLVSS